MANIYSVSFWKCYSLAVWLLTQFISCIMFIHELIYKSQIQVDSFLILLQMCFLLSKDSYGSQHTDLPKDYGINTSYSTKPSFIPFPFGFFLPSLRDAYKNSQLCKSSFVLSPVISWQSVHLVARCFQCHQFHLWFSAGIFAGILFITGPSLVVLFILLLLVGLFGVIHQAVVSFVHCPFRGFA